MKIKAIFSLIACGLVASTTAAVSLPDLAPAQIAQPLQLRELKLKASTLNVQAPCGQDSIQLLPAL